MLLATSVLAATVIFLSFVLRPDAANIAEPSTESVSSIDAAVQDVRGSNADDDPALSPVVGPLDSVGSVLAGTPWTINELMGINDSGDELFEGNAERAEHQRVNARFEKVFVFPDGEALTVSYDYSAEFSDPIEHLDDGVSGGFFDPLSEAAREGNARAAYTLYDSLSYCKEFPNTVGQVNEEVRLVREGRMQLPPGRSPEEHINQLESGFRRCEGTDESMMAEATALLRLAADSGDTRSAIAYAFSLVESNPDIAEEYFNRLWMGGSISGLNGLAEIYGERARANSSHELSVTAYAYAYAALAIRLVEIDGYPEFTRVRTSGLNMLRDLELSASYAVAQSGTTLARDMIVENENCCTR